MNRQEHWIKTEKWQELAQILDLPIVQQALAIIEDEAKPNAPANGMAVQGLNAVDAAFVLTGRLNIQAGIQSAVDRLRTLGRPPKVITKQESPVPFEHITDKNYEQHLQPN